MPDNQELYDKFVVNALNILHSPEVSDGIAQRVQGSDDKIVTIGDESLNVTDRIESKMKATANTIVNGLNVVVGEVIKIAEATGMQPLEDEQKYQAYSWAISNYLNNAVKSGKITKEELAAIADKLKQTEEGQAISQQMDKGQPVQQPGQPQPGQQMPQQGILAGGA